MQRSSLIVTMLVLTALSAMACSSRSSAAEDAGAAGDGTGGNDTGTETGFTGESGQSGETGTGGETGETGGPECEPQAHLDCYAEAAGLMAECADACPCVEVECVEACAATFTATMSSCAEAVANECPEAIDDSWDVCKAACQGGAGECGESCDTHTCAFRAMLCESECGYCIVQGDLAYDYEGSCELELPGSLPASHSPEAYVGREGFSVARDCSTGDEMLWKDDNRDVLVLCDQACQVFADEGSLDLELLPPICD